MKLSYVIILLLVLQNVEAQVTAKNKFDRLVSEIRGDLNKDKISDKVAVMQDTSDPREPYRIQVFFAQPDSIFTLIATSTRLIEPKYPYEPGERNLRDFSEIEIKNGVLIVGIQLIRGHYDHKFRFQNGNFELIGFTEAQSHGDGTMESVDFNLMTGTRVERTERYDGNKLIRNKKSKVWIRPLPKLQDFIPMESELF